MSKAIVVCTTPKSHDWLGNLMTSFNGYDKYPIIILCDLTYELGKMNFIQNSTNITEFFLIHETCEIKDPSIFEKGFNFAGSVAWDSSFKSYLGKYRREILSQCSMPIPKNKMDAVVFEETFNWEYLAKEPKKWILHDDFCHSEIFEEKFGRVNMVLEDEYLKKYKHCWNRNMVSEEM